MWHGNSNSYRLVFLDLPAWQPVSASVLVSVPVFFFLASTISGAPLGIADLATILNDTFPCRAKWYNVGIQLRVDVGTLDCVKVQYDDPGDQLREVVKTWLMSSKNPTWGGLITALKSPVIDESLLARELQQKYCSSGQPPVDSEWIYVTLNVIP